MSSWKGDFTNDYVVNINDAQYVLNWIAAGGTSFDVTVNYSVNNVDYTIPSNQISRLDLTNDGTININDAQYILNWIAAGGNMDNRTVTYSVNGQTYTIDQTYEDPPDGSRIQFENSASLIAVLNDSEHFVKDGDIIAAVDSEGEIYSYESLRVAKNDPPLPNEPNLATINMNNTTNRQYAYDTENYALIIALDNLGVTGSVVTYSIPSGQSISGSTEIISNIRQLTYTPPSSYTGTYVFNDSITYRVSNGTISKEGNISLSIEPKYYFAGNIGLETTMNNISYKYWDSDTRKIYDLIYSFGDNPSIISSDLIIGTPLNPVEFIINQTARKKFRIKKNKNIRNKMFPIRV